VERLLVILALLLAGCGPDPVNPCDARTGSPGACRDPGRPDAG